MRPIPLLAAGLLATAMLAASPARATEEPAYTVIAELPATVEVREYAPMLVAEIEVELADVVRAGKTGFESLAAYIAGANERHERIDQTAPIMQTAHGDGWVVGLPMPARYVVTTLPRPTDLRLRFVEIPRRSVAVIRFGGRWNPIRHAEHWRILQREFGKAGWTATGAPIAAQYNPSWVPGPLRRNEVLVPVRRIR